jgi:hypothetical protein
MADAALPTGNSTLDQFLKVQGAAAAMPPTAGETAARGELAANKGLLGEMGAIRARPTPQLQQQQLPQRPDTSIKQPSWEFLLAAVPMILMGSRKSRAPLTAALTAGGAALQGYNQGQMDQAAQKEREWRDNLDIAIKQNQQELEAYRAAIEKNKGDMDAVIAEIHAHAAAAGDEIALQQIQDGKVKDLFHMIEHRDDMNTKLMEIREQIASRVQMHQDTLESQKLSRDQLAEDRAQRLEETKRHNLELEAEARGRLNATGQKNVDAVSAGLDQVQGLQDMLTKAAGAKGLGITGLGGMGSRVGETISTLFGGGETPASDFQSALDTLKLELPKLLTGTSRSAADERAKIDTILRGLSPGDTPTKTMNALAQVQGILERRKQYMLGGVSEGEQPPVAGAKKAADGNWYVQQGDKWFRVDE